MKFKFSKIVSLLFAYLSHKDHVSARDMVETPIFRQASYHACILFPNNNLKCWGRNDHGQLGIGSTADKGGWPSDMGKNLANVDLGPNRHVTDFCVGSRHTCALLSSGAFICWGSNAYGQLGNGLSGSSFHIGDGPGEMGDALVDTTWPGASVQQISCGYADHTCALLNDSTVWCWGQNNKGQLGLGTTNSIHSDPRTGRVKLPDGAVPVRIETGMSHTCVVTMDGHVYCWGSNQNWEIGETLLPADFGNLEVRTPKNTFDLNFTIGNNISYLKYTSEHEVGTIWVLFVNVEVIITMLFCISRYLHYSQTLSNGNGSTIQRILANAQALDYAILTTLVLNLVYYQLVLLNRTIDGLFVSSFLAIMLKPLVRWVFGFQLYKLEKSTFSNAQLGRCVSISKAIVILCSVVLVLAPVWFCFVVLGIGGLSFHPFFLFVSISSVVTYITISARFVYFMVKMRSGVEELSGSPSPSSSTFRASIICNSIMCLIGCITTITTFLYYETILNAPGDMTDNELNQAEKYAVFRYIHDIDLFLNVIAPAVPSIVSLFVSGRRENNRPDQRPMRIAAFGQSNSFSISYPDAIRDSSSKLLNSNKRLLRY